MAAPAVSFNGGETLVLALQPTHRRILPRHHRQPDAVPRLRRPARQQHAHRAQPLGGSCHHPGRLLRGRRRRERLHRGPPRRSATSSTPAATRAISPATITAPDSSAISQSGPSHDRAGRPKIVKYRFQWTFPILLSPHDPNVLYVTGNHVFRSTDEGASWQEISPDLTRNDQSTLGPSGGPITKDNVGTEYYCTIFAFAESPRMRGLFWAGSDDGLIHISRDDGQHWENVTPPALPEWALISIIEPSPHDPATAYLAANSLQA